MEGMWETAVGLWVREVRGIGNICGGQGRKRRVHRVDKKSSQDFWCLRKISGICRWVTGSSPFSAPPSCDPGFTFYFSGPLILFATLSSLSCMPYHSLCLSVEINRILILMPHFMTWRSLYDSFQTILCSTLLF